MNIQRIVIFFNCTGANIYQFEHLCLFANLKKKTVGQVTFFIIN